MVEQFSRHDIEKELKLASDKLQNEVKTYLIGGCAMTFRNLKPSTKDADLLFEDELQEHHFYKALKEIGFEDLFEGAEYVDLKAKDILIRGKLQFDLFAKQVMGGLTLNSGMIKRAEKYFEFGNLKVYLMAKEDIYLFKAITNRPFPRDFEDLITLQQSGLDWDVIIAEYKKQVKGKEIETKLKIKMAELRKKGFVVPLQKELK
ncbi:MAG: hypothetical protein AABX01_04975 [Candidatus Micrarchaeota archaeon]